MNPEVYHFMRHSGASRSIKDLQVFKPSEYSNISLSLYLRGYLYALSDLVQFVQFKKPEKHPWRSDTFSKVAG